MKRELVLSLCLVMMGICSCDSNSAPELEILESEVPVYLSRSLNLSEDETKEDAIILTDEVIKQINGSWEGVEMFGSPVDEINARQGISYVYSISFDCEAGTYDDRTANGMMEFEEKHITLFHSVAPLDEPEKKYLYTHAFIKITKIEGDEMDIVWYGGMLSSTDYFTAKLIRK